MDILSEFLGTLVLILLGNGVVASVSYKRMYANQSGKWIVITMAWGLAVMMGVIVSLSLGGSAHLNPAVTLLFTITGDLVAWKLPVYILVQIAGAMVAQTILYGLNWNNIKETDMGTVKGSSCTGPNFDNFKEKGVFQNVGYEFVGTMMLLGLIVAFGKGGNVAGLAALGPLPVTLLVMSIGLSLGSVTGYAINPARDLGPRLVFFLFSKFVWKRTEVSAGWDYGWVPVVAPLAAAAVLGLIVKLAS